MMHQEGGIHGWRRGRASMRIASACLVMAYAAGSCAVDDDRNDELTAMHVARGSDELLAIRQLYDLIAAAERLRERPGVSAAQGAALEAAASAARRAVADYVERRQQGQMGAAVIARLGQASAVIVADDVTGVGVADNWLLLACGIAALATTIVADARAPLGEVNAAWEAVGQRLRELDTALSAVTTAMAAATAAATARIEQCRDSTAAGPQLQPLPQPAGRSTVDVIPAPAPERSQPDERRRNTCEAAFPAMAECWTLPADYTFRSPQAALQEMKVSTRNYSLKLHNRRRTQTGPCRGKGFHYNVRAGADRAGSIVCCPCCSDNPSGPVKGDRCRIVW